MKSRSFYFLIITFSLLMACSSPSGGGTTHSHNWSWTAHPKYTGLEIYGCSCSIINDVQIANGISGVTINLGNPVNGNSSTKGQYTMETGLIRVYSANAAESDIILIKGRNAAPYQILIDSAKTIYIAADTEIKGVDGPSNFWGIRVPAGSTITGLGDGITITGGNTNVNGNPSGIISPGSLTLSGTFHSISGGNNTGYNPGGNGIFLDSDLIITAGTIIGSISGGVAGNEAANGSGIRIYT